MAAASPRAMTKSVLALAKTALVTAEKSMPAYSHPNSPKTYTQHQLFAILVVRQFFGLDYRGTAQLLSDWSDLRAVMKLKAVPHFTAIQKAEVRLFKKRGLNGTLTGVLPKPSPAA
jgi:hypothetical protein